MAAERVSRTRVGHKVGLSDRAWVRVQLGQGSFTLVAYQNHLGVLQQISVLGSHARAE